MTTGDQRLIVYFDAEHSGYVWNALQKLGVQVEEQQSNTWTFVPDSEDIYPVEFQGLMPIPGDSAAELTVTFRRIGEPQKPPTVCRLIELALRFEAGAEERARQAMSQILKEYRERYRCACIGADHFLGNPPGGVDWEVRSWPRYWLAAIHVAREKLTSEWQVIGIGSPTGMKGIERAEIVDASGDKITVHTSARYYLRRGEAWAIIEITSDGPNATVKVTAVGADDFPRTTLEGIDNHVREHGAFSHRRMTPTGEQLELEREFTWDDLFLDTEVKDDLRQEIELFFERRDLYESMALPHRRGLLLHGEPGTGKTLFGKILACSFPESAFIWVTATHVESASHIAGVFALARDCPRAILFFEDLDFYASRRQYGRGTESLLGEFLVQMDGMRANDGILIVATTNDLESIEPALSDRPSRFDRTIEFAAGTEAVRRAHLGSLLAPFGADPEAIASIAKRSEGLSGAQLQELALVSRRLALGNADGGIGYDEFEQALEQARKFKSSPAGFGSVREDE